MKTIIEMARKTKLDIYSLTWPHDKFIERLEAFAELVRADEREACAVRADEYMLHIESVTMNVGDAIRARGNT